MIPPVSPAAFEKTAASLGELVREAEIDFPALNRRISRCDLAVCHGTCCHDGVYLNSDEAKLIPQLFEEFRVEFESFGLDLPERPVVFGKWRDFVSGPKTATREEPMSQLAEDYPAHFPETACVFLMVNGKCGLQNLAVAQGRQPWDFKPATCWMHPLSIVRRDGRPPLLTLFDQETDPQKFPDYDGFVSRTHCARNAAAGCGRPAFEVLEDELEMLGKLGRRDLAGEIQSNTISTVKSVD